MASWLTTALVGTVALAAIVTVAVTVPGQAGAPSTPASAPNTGRVPAAWEYDVVTNRHWHPGHAHWHDGPAPLGAGQDTPAPGPTPAAWEYDPVTNRHWHPGHAHWHNGPVPADMP